ncbi:M20 family metallopeptidase [Peptoniphilus sp. GNH]|nr:M20 family metallopeptidase [Peptoniphilus sp. GNH]
MNIFFKRAKSLNSYMLKDRRIIHQMPELGLELPKTKEYIKGRLEEIGLEPIEIGKSGLGAIIKGSKKGKTLLLRADMDALPMAEESGLDFSPKGNTAHTCGHDLHCAMLLCAAQILYEIKENLSGNIKLMFQPAEEIFKGSLEFIKAGFLENPKVDAALALHTSLNDLPGSIEYNEGYVTTSSDNFKIEIQGKGGHGAYPHLCIDPINAALCIYRAFGNLVSRENPPQTTTTLTFGQLSAGSNSNIIPDTAIMQGTMRTYESKVRAYMKDRMSEILKGIEFESKCKIKLDFFSGTPSVYSDPRQTKEFIEILNKKFKELKTIGDKQIMASEDMGYISEKVPTSYLMLNCKVKGNDFAHHNPGVLFNEDAMVYGAAIFATIASEYLK